MRKCVMEPSHEHYPSINIFGERIPDNKKPFPFVFPTSDALRAALWLLPALRRVKQTSHNRTENHSRSSTARQMTFYSLHTLLCVCVCVRDRFIGVIYPAQRASVVRNGGLSARRSLLLCSLYGLH